jgi:hypothetical protein
MVVWKLFNAFMALACLKIILDGIDIVRRKEAVATRKSVFSMGQKMHLSGSKAVVLGWELITIGVVFGLTSAIGVIADTDFIGIPLNFFGGLLCILPFGLPLLVMRWWIYSREDKHQSEPKNG